MNHFEKQLEKLVKALVRGLRANGYKDIDYGDDGAFLFNTIRFYLAPKSPQTKCDHKNMKIMIPMSPLTYQDGVKWCSDCGAFQLFPVYPEQVQRHPKVYALRKPKESKR